MEIVRSGAGDYEFVLRDDVATAACSGAPATMTGTGLLETDERLVIAQPELTCDDGTIPAHRAPASGGARQLHPRTRHRDRRVRRQLRGRVAAGGLERRTDRAPTVRAVPTVPALPVRSPATSGGMWPQSTLDEVRAAQELADAGDPAYTWQLDADAGRRRGSHGGRRSSPGSSRSSSAGRSSALGFRDSTPQTEEVLRRSRVHPLCARPDEPPELPVHGRTARDPRVCADDRRAHVRDGEVQCVPA